MAKKVINYLDADCPLDKNRFAVASPDQGGVERTRLFAKTLGIAETVLVEKKRNLEIKHESKVVEVSGNVSGKTVIIPDDVIVSQKYGEFYINDKNIFHSCGIMYIDDSRIFYCIMTNGLQKEKARETVGVLVNKVYNYVVEARKRDGILSD